MAFISVVEPSQPKNTLSVSLQRGKTTPNEYRGYDTKLSDGEAPEMWSTLSQPLLPGPLWLGFVVLDIVPSIDQIGQFHHLTVCKLITENWIVSVP